MLGYLLENMHASMLKQGMSILTFVASRGGLTRDHLGKLWRAGKQQHSSVRLVVYRYGVSGPHQYIDTELDLLGYVDPSSEASGGP